MKVLAIDVGLKTSGFVLCGVNESEITLLREGEVRTNSSLGVSKRLYTIYSSFKKIIEQESPHILLLERLYAHHRHPTTVGVLSQVRGILLLLAEETSLEIAEYSPTKARKAFLGKGTANSFQIKKMGENILGRKLISEHTADALSLVSAYYNAVRFNQLKNDRIVTG